MELGGFNHTGTATEFRLSAASSSGTRSADGCCIQTLPPNSIPDTGRSLSNATCASAVTSAHLSILSTVTKLSTTLIHQYHTIILSSGNSPLVMFLHSDCCAAMSLNTEMRYLSSAMSTLPWHKNGRYQSNPNLTKDDVVLTRVRQVLPACKP
ncbi:hypothetical protein E2C01_051111 [Portunus trituberculatus]|uniref:Uncharacterized protein n=1 Tax=Portunus trituberculatus TaxID=210409 RepID=A0A5B7GIP2_PORTR|nr:hypothetical protein [Portunus trituberculatus]